MQKARFSHTINDFRGSATPEEGLLIGYGAIIKKYGLKIPTPDKLALISTKNRRYSTEKWEIFTPRHEPHDNLFGQISFAIKYEGINLGVFKSLFQRIDSSDILEIIKNEPNSQSGRKIWFLYEWLMDNKLDIPDLQNRSYIDLLDEKQQYTGKSINSPRHGVRNNLPGTRDFCPLIRKTPKLESLITKNLSAKNKLTLKPIQKDILSRASAFLLLKNSKSSFAIENEYPTNDRLQRWGKTIDQAGNKKLSKDELLNLQKIIIKDDRFIKLGWRKEGGFVGIHDRHTSEPIPDHISAKWEDIERLISGLIETSLRLEDSEIDPVLAAAIISFGFVFIHPMEDGNGRLHRYLINHILVTMDFADKNMVFPISTAILNNIDYYKETLESYSTPLLNFIKWESTPKHNVSILNKTIDYYRYFDATKQAEFLYDCIDETINTIIPNEIKYLQKYDEFKIKIDAHFDMTDKTIALLVKFLEQNGGELSQRAREDEFSGFSEEEIGWVERVFGEVWEIELINLCP